jgi:hypothetical protein
VKIHAKVFFYNGTCLNRLESRWRVFKCRWHVNFLHGLFNFTTSGGARYLWQRSGALWLERLAAYTLIELGIEFCFGVNPLAWNGWRIRNFVERFGKSGQ